MLHGSQLAAVRTIVDDSLDILCRLSGDRKAAAPASQRQRSLPTDSMKGQAVRNDDRTQGGTTLCFEFKRAANDGSVTMVLSIPGREGTVTRSWAGQRPSGLSVPQVDDIRAAVDQALYDWLIVSQGAAQLLWEPD